MIKLTTNHLSFVFNYTSACISHYFILLDLSSQRENSSVAGKASVAGVVIFPDLMS
jgi:hypothetical protein